MDSFFQVLIKPCGDALELEAVQKDSQKSQ